jgi:hypothetical protein
LWDKITAKAKELKTNEGEKIIESKQNDLFLS